MVRQWRGGDSGDGGAILALWAVLVSLVLITAVVFSCAGGASGDKTSAADSYGGAACGGACGGGCGGWRLTVVNHLLIAILGRDKALCKLFKNLECLLPHFLHQFMESSMLSKYLIIITKVYKKLHLFSWVDYYWCPMFSYCHHFFSFSFIFK